MPVGTGSGANATAGSICERIFSSSSTLDRAGWAGPDQAEQRSVFHKSNDAVFIHGRGKFASFNRTRQH